MEPVSWRILMVDDDNDDYLIAKLLLDQARDRKIILDWAQTYESGKISLTSNHYDAVLVDYDLGARTGIEFIRQAVASGYHAPFILFTGRGSYEVDLEAMQAGASLYLTKGEANQLLLERGIRYAIERKGAERALRESEENYRQLFNAMLDGFALHEIICDPNGVPIDYRFLEVNPAFERLTGLKAADILGKTVLEVLPETEDNWIQTYGEVALTGNAIRFENYARALGKHFEVVAFSPRRGQFAAVFTDITRRKAAEKALLAAQEELEQHVQERTYAQRALASAEMLEGLFQSAPDAILLIDDCGELIRVNRQAEMMLGYLAEELYGETLEVLLPERLRSMHAARRSVYLNSPTLQPMGLRESYICRRKDGEEFPVGIMLSPFKIEDRLHVICVIREV